MEVESEISLPSNRGAILSENPRRALRASERLPRRGDARRLRSPVSTVPVPLPPPSPVEPFTNSPLKIPLPISPTDLPARLYETPERALAQLHRDGRGQRVRKLNRENVNAARLAARRHANCSAHKGVARGHVRTSRTCPLLLGCRISSATPPTSNPRYYRKRPPVDFFSSTNERAHSCR